MATGVDLPLVAIVGPTASGKTSIAIDLAMALDGEIVSADSRAIYKGMDLGTAKPSASEQALVPHWLIDVVGSGDPVWTVVDFQRAAKAAICDIRSRGKLPILAGGTGLYVDSVIFDYQFGSRQDESERKQLDEQPIEWLIDYCSENNITLPANFKNKRHLIHAILNNGKYTDDNVLIDNLIVVGISTNTRKLDNSINERMDTIFAQDVVNETIRIKKMYADRPDAIKSNIYLAVQRYLDGETTLEIAKQQAIRLDRALVKRQMTWFRRNLGVVWLERDELFSFVSSAVLDIKQTS